MIDIFFQQIEDICRFHYWAVQQCIKNIEANIFDIVIQKMTLKPSRSMLHRLRPSAHRLFGGEIYGNISPQHLRLSVRIRVRSQRSHHLIHQLERQILMGHFTAAKCQSDL